MIWIKSNDSHTRKLPNMQKYTIRHGKNNIEFYLLRKKVKNINLRTKADLSVTVSANKNVPLEYILDFVKRKADWIISNQEEYSKMNKEKTAAIKYTDGEKVFLLGEQLTLSLQQSQKEKVMIQDGTMKVLLKNIDDETRKKNLIRSFYIKTANEVFIKSKERMVKKTGLSFDPELKMRRMVSRFGSCYVNKRIIILNSGLIYAPVSCIDYVVLHELIHFTYLRHDKKFYDLLTSYMPDWKEKKKIVDNIDIRNRERLV